MGKSLQMIKRFFIQSAIETIKRPYVFLRQLVFQPKRLTSRVTKCMNCKRYSKKIKFFLQISDLSMKLIVLAQTEREAASYEVCCFLPTESFRALWKTLNL